MSCRVSASQQPLHGFTASATKALRWGCLPQYCQMANWGLQTLLWLHLIGDIYIYKKGTVHFGVVCNFSTLFWRTADQTLILIGCTALSNGWRLCEAESGHQLNGWVMGRLQKRACSEHVVDGSRWSPSHGFTWDFLRSAQVPRFQILKGPNFVWQKQRFPALKTWPDLRPYPEPARGAEVRKGGVNVC